MHQAAPRACTWDRAVQTRDRPWHLVRVSSGVRRAFDDTSVTTAGHTRALGTHGAPRASRRVWCLGAPGWSVSRMCYSLPVFLAA